MTQSVKSSRSYVSPRREEHAALTRQAILEAARRLFEDDGYVNTSMPAVATEARVAVKTVYLAFGSKAGLLRAVWDRRLAGDEAGVPVRDRAWFRDVEEDDSPTGKIRRLARQSAGVKQRTGRLLVMIRDAARTDPEIASLWDEIQGKLYDVSLSVVRQLRALGALPAGADAKALADVVWTLNHPSTWQLLVLERGWSHETYSAWLETSFGSVLLRE